MKRSDIQKEIDMLKDRLQAVNEAEKMKIQSRLYVLEQKKKISLAEEAKAQYAEAGWNL